MRSLLNWENYSKKFVHASVTVMKSRKTRDTLVTRWNNHNGEKIFKKKTKKFTIVLHEKFKIIKKSEEQ